MSISIREQIVAAVKADLLSSSALSAALVGTKVDREREEPVSRDECPHIILYPQEDQPVQLGEGLLDQTLTLDVAIYTRGDATNTLDDPVAQEVRRAVLSSAALAALCIGCFERGSKWQRNEGDQTIGVLTIQYQFRYLSSRAGMAAIIR